MHRCATRLPQECVTKCPPRVASARRRPLLRALERWCDRASCACTTMDRCRTAPRMCVPTASMPGRYWCRAWSHSLDFPGAASTFLHRRYDHVALYGGFHVFVRGALPWWRLRGRRAAVRGVCVGHAVSARLCPVAASPTPAHCTLPLRCSFSMSTCARVASVVASPWQPWLRCCVCVWCVDGQTSRRLPWPFSLPSCTPTPPSRHHQAATSGVGDV
jgi:hypothetical protein